MCADITLLEGGTYRGYADEDTDSVTPNEHVIGMLSPEGGGEEVQDVHCDEQGQAPSVLGSHDQLHEGTIRGPLVHCKGDE